MIGWAIGLAVLAGLGIAGGIGWSKLQREHQEARNVPIKDVNFRALKDGKFHGAYTGGMYKWRANECDVQVADGKVTGIDLAASQDPAAKNMQHRTLFDRVLQSQTLQVDTVSGATLTSKAYLKAVEDALVKAQQA